MGESNSERQPVRTAFIEKMADLHHIVGDLIGLYTNNGWLIEEYDISSLTPMSVNKWELELAKFLTDPKGYRGP